MCWLDMLPATWLTTAASSQTLTQEDCAWQTLLFFSSVGHTLTSVTEHSVQLDLVWYHLLTDLRQLDLS